MIYVKTPATSANLGCGFDSIGMAFKMYNELWVEEADCELEIKILKQQKLHIPSNENNMIYRTMKDFFRMYDKKMPGIRMYQKDDIPMTRGLGSSAACIVAGLLAANELSGMKLPLEEIVQISSKIEGHPDNVAPALLGGVVVGALDDKELKYVRFDTPNDLQFAVMIPSFPMSTEKARNVLPKEIPHKDAVFNSSRAGLLIASLLTGQYDNLKMALDDRLHQPYRKTIIANMENIFEKAEEFGAKGFFLSGAGPTLIAVLTENNSFMDNMGNYLGTIEGGWDLKILETDNIGAFTGDKPAPV